MRARPRAGRLHWGDCLGLGKRQGAAGLGPVRLVGSSSLAGVYAHGAFSAVQGWGWGEPESPGPMPDGTGWAVG